MNRSFGRSLGRDNLFKWVTTYAWMLNNEISTFYSLPCREVWPDETAFGNSGMEPEEELQLLQDVFKANLGQSTGKSKSPQ